MVKCIDIVQTAYITRNSQLLPWRPYYAIIVSYWRTISTHVGKWWIKYEDDASSPW